MKKYLAIFFFLITNICFSQKNNVSKDSLLKMLQGDWMVIEKHCKDPFYNDSLNQEMTFNKNIVSVILKKNDTIVSKISGKFIIDSVNTIGYSVYIKLDEEFVIKDQNVILLYMQLYGKDKILVAWHKMIYYKDEQKAASFIGSFQFYKIES